MRVAKKPNGGGICVGLWFVLLGMGLVGWGNCWAQNYRVYHHCCRKNEHRYRKLENRRRRLHFQRRYVHEFLNNAEFRERIVRERLGYVGPDEYIVRIDPRREPILGSLTEENVPGAQRKGSL